MALVAPVVLACSDAALGDDDTCLGPTCDDWNEQETPAAFEPDTSDGADSPIYRISPDYTTDVSRRRFASLDAFAANVSCVRAGEQIQLQEGATYHGRLRLKECLEAGESTEDTLLIRSFVAGAPLDDPLKEAVTSTHVLGSRALTSLGMAWEPVEGLQGNGKPIAHLADKKVYRVGPFAQEVKQIHYEHWRMPVARHPSLPFAGYGGGNPDYFTYQEIFEYSPDGCQAGYCLVGQAGDEAARPIMEYGFDTNTYAVVRNSGWSLARSSFVCTHPTNPSSFALGRLVPSGDGLVVSPSDSLRKPETGGQLGGAGCGFALVNAIGLIDSPGEWYFNPADGYVYLLYFDDGDAANPFADEEPQAAGTTVSFVEPEENAWDHANATISFAGSSDASAKIRRVEIHNLRLMESTGSSIRVHDVDDVTIENVSIYGSNAHGIELYGIGGDVLVSSSSITSTLNNGLDLWSAGTEPGSLPTVTVYGSQFQRNGLLGNHDRYGMNLVAIRLGGYGSATIAGNTFSQSGWSSFMATEPADLVDGSLQFSQNEVSGFCTLLNDCGGFYVNGADPDFTRPDSDYLMERKWIFENTFTASSGPNTDGLPLPPVTLGQEPIITGIYFDHHARGYSVWGNVFDGSYYPYSEIINKAGSKNRINN
ncbi:MAG: right-handed parallel beta-helix repeat-containing protein [Deltaproteobacteria bacterium]|nr:right-handed parallel beta-helix repeat-containing protein [Deltaproteobacteria bacterium]MBW2535926.1 right-handed parallel beta-helix repeat-containing protein [Deltaproteobacteria bacterium]